MTMRARLITLAALATVAASAPAQAQLVFKSSPVMAAPTASPSTEPSTPPPIAASPSGGVPARSATPGVLGVLPAPRPGGPVAAGVVPASADHTPVQSAGSVLNGFGKDIPLRLALRQVIPLEYEVTLAPSDPIGNEITSWQGGRPWKAVLDDLSARHHLQIRFDGNRAVVNGGGGGEAAPVTGAPMAAAPTASEPSPERLPESQPERPRGPTPTGPLARDLNGVPRPVSGGPVDAVPSAGVYGAGEAHEGLSVRATLDEWTQRGGGRLVWHCKNVEYPLYGTNVFEGDFKQAAADLLMAFADVRPAIDAAFYPDNKPMPHLVVTCGEVDPSLTSY